MRECEHAEICGSGCDLDDPTECGHYRPKVHREELFNLSNELLSKEMELNRKSRTAIGRRRRELLRDTAWNYGMYGSIIRNYLGIS